MIRRRDMLKGAAGLALAAAARPLNAAGRNRSMLVYLGTYSQRGSQGVYVARFDPATGALALTGQTAELQNASFQAVHPSGKWLYSVSEIGNFNGTRGGGVAALAIEPKTGALTLLNQQPTLGGAPCHVVVDPSGSCIVTANYSGGNVAVHPITTDGGLSEMSCLVQHQGQSVNPQRQEGPHAHSVTLAPSDTLAFVCDLGLDQVLAYDLEAAAGKLTAHTPPHAATHAGAGPRHMAFSPDGGTAYVINELDSTMTVFAFDAAAGALAERQHLSTLPDGFGDTSHCADVHVHPNGRFVYGSNRGHDSIVIYAVDAATGGLTTVGWASTRGRTPRNFRLSPDGAWLVAANQDTDSLAVYAVDSETGGLTPTGDLLAVPAPVCVTFAPEVPAG